MIVENNIYIHVDSDTELLNSMELHGNRSNSKKLHASIVEESLKENNIKELYFRE